MDQESPRGLLLAPPMTYRPVCAVPHVSVSETAITLKLPPVPLRRPRFEAWPVAVAAGVAAVAVGWMLHARPAPAVAKPQHMTAAVGANLPRALPPQNPEPVLASAANVALEFELDEVEIVEEDDEIVILDESEPDPVPPPPKKVSRATQRERARAVARTQMKKGRAAQSMGNRAAAKKAYEAALAALPSYAPAAAALAELHMKRRKYKLALRYARRASRAAPRKLDYMLLLGDAYFLTKNRKAARKVWRKAAAYGSAKAKSRLGG